MTHVEQITVSTDIGGISPDFWWVHDVYKKAGFRNPGLEVVWTRNNSQAIHDIYTGRSSFTRINGFHSQLGAEEDFRQHNKGLFDWLLIQVADKLMPRQGKENNLLIDMFNPLNILPPLLIADMTAVLLDRDIYLNIHDDVARQQYDQYKSGLNELKLPNRSKLPRARLVVENGSGPNAVNNVVRLVDRFRQDIGNSTVAGLFDVVHSIVGLNGGETPDIQSCRKHWPTMMSQIDRKTFTNLHFPIGENIKDSLPILDMIHGEIGMLQDLADTVKGMQITIENQHSLLFGATLKRDKEVDRLKMIYEGMNRVGMVN